MVKPGSVTRAGFARSPICGTYFFCGLHIASNGATVGMACKMQVTLERKIAMSHTAVLLHSTRRTRGTTVAIRSFVIIILALWFALSFTLGARGAFLNRPGTPPFALLTAVVVPIGVFLSVYWTWRAFHEFVLTADVALLTATQSWRFGGLGFIALYMLGLLPGYFAWPAGIGDMVIGVTAPWVVLALARNEQFAASKTFAFWNIFGIFDFAVLAIGSGAVAPLIFPRLLQTVTSQTVTAAPMRHLPLSLIPTFLVPMFTIFHLIALFQARAVSSAKD